MTHAHNRPHSSAKPSAKSSARPSAGPRITPELTPGVEELEAQERRLVFRTFTADDAWALGTLLVELARERQAPVAIDIHRAGQQLFHAALPGATPDNDAWIARKRRVVERYGSASYLVGARCRAKGTTFEESSRLDPDQYAAHGGSFPITVAEVGVIGAVTVSGLPQLQDHNFVVEALDHFLTDQAEAATDRTGPHERR